MIAFADQYIDRASQSGQCLDVPSIPFTRLPIPTSREVARNRVEELLKEWSPDWTSLQFVPYSFHPKGCPDESRFPFCTPLGGCHHLMVHETWIGQHPSAGLRQRILGFLQQHASLRAIRAWKAKAVHTSCDIYKRRLAGVGVSAGILPMFGTIVPDFSLDESLSEEVFQYVVQKSGALAPLPRNRCRLVVMFGSLYEVSGLIEALNRLVADANRRGLYLVVCFCGHPSPPLDRVVQSLRSGSTSVPIAILGAADSRTLSRWFQGMDIGVATTPLDGIGKSSAAACLRDHGLPVVCVDRGAYVGQTSPPHFFLDDFIQSGLLEYVPRYLRRDRVVETAAMFLSELQAEVSRSEFCHDR